MVMVAVCLNMMLGFVAVAIDGGLLQDTNRRAQSAADAAAFAAAEDLFWNFRTQNGSDPLATAKQKAIDLTVQNGFPTPTVNIPPLSGPFTGKPRSVEAILSKNEKRSF